jgi:hypothetical protein
MYNNRIKLKAIKFLDKVLLTTSFHQQIFSKKRLLTHLETKPNLIYFKILQTTQIITSLASHKKDLPYLNFHHQINQIFLLITIFKKALFSILLQICFRQTKIHYQ